MFNKKQLEIILEKFYLSCNLPISAFEYDGTLISSYGYNISSSFDDHEITENLKSKLKNKPLATLASNGALFTSCYISKEIIHSGIFVIGPYTDNLNNNKYVYKDISIMEQLMSLLYIICNDISSKDSFKETKYSLHVNKAIDYIKVRYKENINLNDVADYLNINKCYLCSLIKKETNMTFTYLLNSIRIKKSKELLKNNCFTVLDVALAVGYNNQNYYNIMFKKITDLTPLEYRKK